MEDCVVDGCCQAYTKYCGKGTIREYLAEDSVKHGGTLVDSDPRLFCQGTLDALFLAEGSPDQSKG